MSVFLRADLEAEGLSDEVALEERLDNGLVCFTAGFVRRLGQRVVRSPRPTGPPGHADVVGDKPRMFVQTPLSDCSEWVINVPDRECKPPLAEVCEDDYLDELIARRTED
jgi:hypothetical protein